MRKLFIFLQAILSFAAVAQVQPVEPMQSSYENKDLIMLALAAFGVLMAIFFLWRRARKRKRGY